MNKDSAIRHLKKIARQLQSYSADGQHMHIHGPRAGQAWEFGCEIEMALKAIDPPTPPLPTINPELIPSKET
jgi:hypothetical protein